MYVFRLPYIFPIDLTLVMCNVAFTGVVILLTLFFLCLTDIDIHTQQLITFSVDSE